MGQLAPKWMFTLPNARRLEVTPVVVDGVMYIAAANEAYALDARTGRQIWHYQRPLTKGVIGDAASAINRGVAVLGDKVFMVTDHAHMLALHRANGQLLWDTEIADYKQHYGTTSAPLVVDDLVITGTSGGDEGARGFIAAFKASTGELAWKHWTMPAPGEPGSETWIGRAIEHGCSAPWLTGSYDPELKLIYWTTGNPCPDYNGDERKGDNLYTSSVIALEPATGKRRWYFQFTPHDLHDWDAAQPVLVVNTNFRGKPRKLLLQANRNGFFYVLDRVTGEFLLGEPFVKKMTWASGIDEKGRPKVLPNTEPTVGGIEGLSRSRRRDELDVEFLQRGDRALLCDVTRKVQHLHEVVGLVGAGQVILWGRHAPGAWRERREDSPSHRYPDRQGYMGTPADRTCQYLGRSSFNGRRGIVLSARTAARLPLSTQSRGSRYGISIQARHGRHRQ